MREQGPARSVFAMSAAEIIELIEKLPPSEQQQVREFLAKKLGVTDNDGIRRMDLAKAKAIGDGLFERHPELFRRLAQ